MKCSICNTEFDPEYDEDICLNCNIDENFYLDEVEVFGYNGENNEGRYC